MQKETYPLEVFYLDLIDIERDNDIKGFVESLLKNGFGCKAEWLYQEAAYGEIHYRWIGWELDKRLTQEEKTRVVITIGAFLEGVGVSEI